MSNVSDESSSIQYDVAISFAGEDRATARKFADLLLRDNTRFFLVSLRRLLCGARI